MSRPPACEPGAKDKPGAGEVGRVGRGSRWPLAASVSPVRSRISGSKVVSPPERGSGKRWYRTPPTAAGSGRVPFGGGGGTGKPSSAIPGPERPRSPAATAGGRGGAGSAGETEGPDEEKAAEDDAEGRREECEGAGTGSDDGDPDEPDSGETGENDGPGEAGTTGEDDGPAEEVDGVAEDDQAGDDDSAGKDDQAGAEDSAGEGDQAAEEDDGAGEDDQAGAEDSAGEGGQTGEEGGGAGEEDQAGDDGSAEEADGADEEDGAGAEDWAGAEETVAGVERDANAEGCGAPSTEEGTDVDAEGANVDGTDEETGPERPDPVREAAGEADDEETDGESASEPGIGGNRAVSAPSRLTDAEARTADRRGAIMRAAMPKTLWVAVS